ncbi:MAG: glycoside hydrolase family 38 C-terminal domain-containing protein, partial [bacterium]
GASQAQLYAFTKQHYPALYARIKQAVAAGRWEVQGGMWVEADCNLIGGESMVRQFVHGKNFFRDEFGIDVKNLWLPDVFGYSGNLPQMLRRAGMDYFLTQKLSWNRYNKFPHNTFIWRGIDGSEVLAHFPPEDCYNGQVTPAEVVRNEWNNKEAGLVQEAISLFGIGNGGGGPKEENIERALRLHNLNGCPRFHFGFAQPVLEKMATYKADLDTWCGELYFELHRGTLTTQAAIKRWNRRAEEALRAAEALCAAAGTGTYPAADFDTLWKTLLINQFHDIIPGSSIHRVYAEAVPQLQDIVKRCGELAMAAAGRMLASEGGALTLFNPSSTPFKGVVRLPAGWTGVRKDACVKAVQSEGDACMARVAVPANGFATLRNEGRAEAAAEGPATGALVLENESVRYTFDHDLRLTGAFDKEAQRELVATGAAGNMLELFDDHPHNFDAWDIEEYYRTMRVGTASAEGGVMRIDGSARSGLRAVLRIGKSVLTQTVWLEADGKRLDFVTGADWDERHKLLRVAFPTTIVSDEAKCEIQYGHVSRATHDNTKWQYAQFEAAGHRWADLSERDYGVALLNDSKYGYRVKGGSLELTLLRSPTEPDPLADVGRHEFTYSILPHVGDLAASDVRANAAVLNQGVTQLDGFAAGGTALPITVEGEGIELAVLKRAEKSGCLVIRVVEARGLATGAVLRSRDPNRRFVETDLLEWKDGVPSATAEVRTTFKPFEIRTWKLV